MSVQPRKSWYRGVEGTGRGGGGWVGLVALAVAGCGFFDEAAEEQRRLRDLELELTPMANGAEDLAQKDAGLWVLYQALLADVLQGVGSLNDVDRLYQGISYRAQGWFQARQLASVVEERLLEELDPPDAEGHPLMAQVRWASGLADLYLGMTFCTIRLEERIVTDQEMLGRAEQSLGAAIESAGRAGSVHYLNAAHAGRAQARMLLEDWAGAESDAMTVPVGYSYVSYHIEGDPNSLWWFMINRRRAGFLHKWWPLIEESEAPGFMIDPWSGQEDFRIPVHYDGGTLRDSEIPHYQPLKYTSEEDDIPIVHYDMAQLIIAEARAVRGDYAGATVVLNALRAAVGLPPHETPTSAEEMEELILWERFAELHLEGQRLIDLHRKGLMEEVFEELNDPERPGVGRPSKWGECEGG